MLYKVTFVNGHTLRMISSQVTAETEKEAVNKVFDSFGSGFEHRLVMVEAVDEKRQLSVGDIVRSENEISYGVVILVNSLYAYVLWANNTITNQLVAGSGLVVVGHSDRHQLLVTQMKEALIL